MKISFSAAQSATFIVQTQMERHADNTKNSMEKNYFQDQIYSLNPHVFMCTSLGGRLCF